MDNDCDGYTPMWMEMPPKVIEHLVALKDRMDMPFFELNEKKQKNLIKELNWVGEFIHSMRTPFEIVVDRKTFWLITIPNIISGDIDSFMNPSTLIFARSKEEYNEMIEYLTDKYRPVIDPSVCTIYRYNPMAGGYTKTNQKVAPKTKDDLYGLDYFFDTMEKDITALKEREREARLTGASNGINYLLYGKPGTGKSSSTMALARMIGATAIYIVSLGDLNVGSIQNVLNPKIMGNGIKIVLIEDFDRFVDKHGDKVMSLLLNGLEGVQDSYGTIRLFSANYPDMVLEDDALASRFTRFIEFPEPDKEVIYKHLVHVYPELTSEAEILSEVCHSNDWTIRDINRYISRFIMYDNPLMEAIIGFEEYMKLMVRIRNKNLMEESEDDDHLMEESDDDVRHSISKLFQRMNPH